ncbi:MAG: hypothetical protein ACH37Z_02245 [Anaerolineae bacterium]
MKRNNNEQRVLFLISMLVVALLSGYYVENDDDRANASTGIKIIGTGDDWLLPMNDQMAVDRSQMILDPEIEPDESVSRLINYQGASQWRSPSSVVDPGNPNAPVWIVGFRSTNMTREKLLNSMPIRITIETAPIPQVAHR